MIYMLPTRCNGTWPTSISLEIKPEQKYRLYLPIIIFLCLNYKTILELTNIMASHMLYFTRFVCILQITATELEATQQNDSG